MSCLGISSLSNLLPSWVKRLIATTSDSDQSYTSPSRNTSLQEEEGSSSPASRQSPINSTTGYVPGITVLPSSPPAYPFTTSKSAVHEEVDVNEYQSFEPFSLNRTPPIPKERGSKGNKDGLPTRHEPLISFSPTSYMPASDKPTES